MVASQAMARSPSKFLQAVAEVAEEDSATSSDVRRWVRPGGELPVGSAAVATGSSVVAPWAVKHLADLPSLVGGSE